MTLFGYFQVNFHILTLKTCWLWSTISTILKNFREQCSRARTFSHVCNQRNLNKEGIILLMIRCDQFWPRIVIFNLINSGCVQTVFLLDLSGINHNQASLLGTENSQKYVAHGIWIGKFDILICQSLTITLRYRYFRKFQDGC